MQYLNYFCASRLLTFSVSSSYIFIDHYFFLITYFTSQNIDHKKPRVN